MKKFKLLSPILAGTAAIAPITALANCSCSNIDYTGITKALKQDALQYFETLLKVYRPTFACQPAYDFINRTMKELGYTETGHDDWSDVARKDKAPIPEDQVYGNVWYDIPASEGCEAWPKVIFSAYYDMPYDCDDKDLEKIRKEGIKVHIDEDNQLMTSQDGYCTCGFNDGLGISSMLSLAKNHNMFKHGPVRLLFTADSGDSTDHWASGAQYLKVSQEKLSGAKKPFDTPFVINTDGNVQAEINVSSAGIHQCNIENKLFTKESGDVEEVTLDKFGPALGQLVQYTINVSGLTGGHSATDINSQRGNALKLLFEFITTSNSEFRIVHCQTDNLQDKGYQIPSGASATIIIKRTEDLEEVIKGKIETIVDAYQNQFPAEKGKIKIDYQPITTTANVTCLTHEKSQKVCAFINLMKFGPQVWFDEKHTEVKTSSNIGPLSIEQSGNNMKFSGRFTCRSANEIQLEIFSSYTHSYLRSLLGIVEQIDYVDYNTPVWENSEEVYKLPNKMSRLMMDGYRRFRYTPKEVNCHGWLEAACFPSIIETLGTSVIPYIATIGPTITDPQTRKEKLYISTLNSCLRVLIFVLSNAPALNA